MRSLLYALAASLILSTASAQSAQPTAAPQAATSFESDQVNVTTKKIADKMRMNEGEASKLRPIVRRWVAEETMVIEQYQTAKAAGKGNYTEYVLERMALEKWYRDTIKVAFASRQALYQEYERSIFQVNKQQRH